jgi:HEAT repeat protein
MVEETFEHERLPEDFAANVRDLLDAAAQRGRKRTAAIERLAGLGAGAVEPLCEALGDPRGPVRYAAAAALCKIGDARALRPLLRLLYANDSCLTELFRKGHILGIPGVRKALLQAVQEGESEKRCMAATALAKLRGDEEVIRCLLALFRDRRSGDLAIRRSALQALFTLEPRQIPSLTAEALTERPFRRRSTWIWWYCLRHGHELPVETCLAGFGRPVPALGRLFAGQLLLRHGDAGRKVLEHLLDSSAPDRRAFAALALAPSRHPAAFDVLVEELSSHTGDPKWRRIVTRALTRSYARRLKAWALEKGDDLRRFPAAACAVALVSPKAGDEALRALLTAGPPAARSAAIAGLARQSDAGAIDELRACLRPGRPGKVARRAFREMLRLGEPALPTVRAMLGSPEWPERKAAVGLLKRWGALTPQDVAAATNDPHVAVRHAAAGRN